MAKKLKFTEEQIFDIINTYKTNPKSTSKVIGEKYNVCGGSIINLLKEHNIPIKTNNDYHAYKFSIKETNEILEKYQNGTTKKGLANEYNLSPGALHRFLTENNIKVRNKQDIKKIKPDQHQKIIDLYVKENLNAVEIGKLYNTSYNTILIILKLNNIKRKAPSERLSFFSPEIEKEVCKIYQEQNKSASELGRIYGCSNEGPIIRVLKKNKIQVKKCFSPINTRGISGYYKDFSFRSLNELSFMINYLEKKNIKFKNGEISEYKIEYFNLEKNKIRNYYPDFITDKYIFECKPKAFWQKQETTEKANAAKIYCEQNNLQYRILDYPVIIYPILEKINNQDVTFVGNGEEKFNKNYKRYL